MPLDIIIVYIIPLTTLIINIILTIVHKVKTDKHLKNPVIAILFSIEILTILLAYLYPLPDGGMIFQVLFFELIGIILLILQLFYLIGVLRHSHQPKE